MSMAMALWYETGLLIGHTHILFYFIFSVACSKTQNIQYQRGIKGLIEPTPTKPNKMTYFGDK